jgi:F0F1-type ATP synthase assembly protein I
MTPPDPQVRSGTDGPVIARYESLVADLLSGVIVWGGIGWALDTWVLHTWPWGMVTGVILGFAAGTYLLYLRTEELGRAEDERRAAS